MAGTSLDPGLVASFRPDGAIHLPRQLFPERLRFAANLIKFPDEDIHAREVGPLHPETDCKVRSFRQTAPVGTRTARARSVVQQYQRRQPTRVPSSAQHDTCGVAHRLRPQLFGSVVENTFMAAAIIPATSDTLAGTTTVFVVRAISPNCATYCSATRS